MRRLFTLLTITLLSFISRSQDLFAIDTIRTVEINFYDANWEQLLDSFAMAGVGTGSGEERILAQVIFDGIPFDSCGVRYKGNSSMDTSKVKNPFNIDLNWVIQGQKYMGKNKIKLANNFSDPSMVREALMYELSNQYMDCPHGSFVKLTVNGDYYGIYTNTESIDNEFLDQYYGSSDNPFFKCDPFSFQLYGDNSNLAYYPDTLAYDTLYHMKSLFGTTELQTLTYNLEFNAPLIEQYLDVDRALWFLSLSSAFVHNDGYTAFGHNYYVYKMDNGIWSIVMWDVNMSFGGLLWNGTNFWPLVLTDLQYQDPYLHETAYNFKPLIARLLSIPRYKKMYTAHYRTIIEENIANGYYLQRAEYMHNMLDPEFANEAYNDYTYQEFTDNIYTDVGVWFDLRPGLQNLMQERNNYFDTLPEFQFAQPVITNVTPSATQPIAYSTVTFTAEVSGADLVALGYRFNKFDVFSKIQMFDDGAHNDGAAGDGVYGIDIPISYTDVQYYIYAENANAAKFSPVRAEYEFYTLVPFPGVVINEIDAINTANAIDQNFEYDDWIELYNNSGATINLSGYGLSDNPNNPDKWTFPDTTIAPYSYLIVWADNDTLQAGLHANYSLSSLGESLLLTDNNGALLDSMSYPAQIQNYTYGRYPNGAGNFAYMFPTFSAENVAPLGLTEEKMVDLNVFPNPASDEINVQFSEVMSGTIKIIDLTGEVLTESIVQGSDHVMFDVSTFAPGFYFIAVDKGNTVKFVVE